MKVQLQQVLPAEIEKRSFEIITEELGGIQLPPEQAPIIKRCIHTSADFDYARTLTFTHDAVRAGLEALRDGASIVTDTEMARAGIHKAAAETLGCRVLCFMGDAEVARQAREAGTTRAQACMDRAAALDGGVILAVGNAPTALVRLYELIQGGTFRPRLIIGVPVGFVNAAESKELILQTDVPVIAARGRKGGSNIAAAICNALLYEATGRSL